MTAHSAEKIAHMLADGFQSHGDPLVLQTSTRTVFTGSTFDIEVEDDDEFDDATYLVTVRRVTE